MIDLGVQMFTLRRYTQTEAELVPALAQLHEIGYRSIQVSAFGAVSYTHLTLPTIYSV